MVEKIQQTLRDSKAARWSALVLIALMMFFAYMFVDVMSPLQSLIESSRGWTPDVFGTYAASEYILNVCGFL
ncbi:MAG: MFS transporter, partial [Bacteroidales bacterium]|nr:MFS transporter [Bacteroidales bacterium]